MHQSYRFIYHLNINLLQHGICSVQHPAVITGLAIKSPMPYINSSTTELEASLAGLDQEKYIFRLHVAGMSPRSLQTVEKKTTARKLVVAVADAERVLAGIDPCED